MIGIGIRVVMVVAIALNLVGLAEAQPAFSENYQSLLVKGKLQVGQSAGNATFTVNGTQSFAGPISIPATNTHAIGEFLSVVGETTKAIVVALPDDSYEVLYPPTVGVSVSGSSSKTAAGWSANYVATAAVSQTYIIIDK